MTAPAESCSHTVSYWNVGFFGNSEEKTRGQLSVLRHDLVSCLSQLENNVVDQPFQPPGESAVWSISEPAACSHLKNQLYDPIGEQTVLSNW